MNPRRLAGHPLRAVILASWVLFTVGARPAFASGSLPTQPEYFLLPEYCQAIVAEEIRSQPRLRHNLTLLPPTAVQRWRLRIGPDFEHLGHYCSGLRALSRALDLSTPRRSARRTVRHRQSVRSRSASCARSQVHPCGQKCRSSMHGRSKASEIGGRQP
jgi:hypothetical protein